MAHRIEVGPLPGTDDPRGAKVKAEIREVLGLPVKAVQVLDVYTLDGEFSDEELERVGGELLANPVVETFSVNRPLAGAFDWLVEVGLRPGVTDNVGHTACVAASDLLGREIKAVFSSRQYLIKGKLDKKNVQKITDELLHNTLIERTEIIQATDFDAGRGVPAVLPVVKLDHEIVVETVNLEIDDEALEQLSRGRLLALTLPEMQTIRDYYRQPKVQKARQEHGLPPDKPTDAELEALAQTWSEHCKHKIFNAEIEYQDGHKTQTIKSLFKTFIRGSTEEIAKKKNWLVSVFTDNAGIIKFNKDWNLVMKVETHNTPSALDPYGGGITGILGCNRDSMGTGMGSKLIFNTDVFCFASPFYDQPLPPRLLHPKRIFEGVRRAVEHGGNKMGIPTLNGSVVFDGRYLGKPLVYCGTAGIIPAKVNNQPSESKEIAPGDAAVMVGGRIGADGIHGATFSSVELDESSPATAVQIGDPITQKNMFDFLLEARDLGLFKTLTDNGAGGLSSSIGELAQISGGCEMYLEKAPLKYPGLNPWEILISESQERMTVVVPTEKLDEFLELSARREVESSAVGIFTDSGRFHVRHGERVVADLDLDFLHNGLPPMKLEAVWKAPKLAEPELKPANLTKELISLLGRLNICSKEYLVRQYDHEVQGGSVVKPLTGADNDGPSDAGVVRPLLGTAEGVVASHGICPRYSDIDTYHMMANAIDEAVRNAVAVGADPGHLAGLDNFCWSDPVYSKKNPDGKFKLAQLVRANQALYDYTVAFGVPCISGKDSMKNDYTGGEVKISVPPTVLFSVIGKVPDVTKAVTMDVKQPGDLVYVLGVTEPELGGSEYYAQHGEVGASVPEVDAAAASARYQALHRAIGNGLVASAHDCSDGGLGVALAESAFAGGYGLEIDLAKLPTEGVERDDQALFSESASRLVVTVTPEHQKAFEKAMDKTGWAQIGTVRQDGKIIINSLRGKPAIVSDIASLKKAWQQPLGT